ncbi:MAG TPA: hypothetical protein VIA18_16760 [Polyangia bacterium]|jgi:hypothetical protein|nr:hypothetical protein [Polyangia bacterium]
MNARDWNPIVCAAIGRRVLLTFDYDGEPRVVAPYCHGVTTAGREALRAVQVLGGTHGGDIASGKLWTVDKLVNLRALDDPFVASDPKYNPDDSAFAEIHCRIEPRRKTKNA